MVGPAVQIGPATAAEIPRLQEVEGRAAALFRTHPQTAALYLPDTPRERFTRAQLAGLLWVARAGTEPVGFALAEDLGTSLHLEELDVAPESGRQGIGRGLIGAVAAAAASRGVPVTLCTFTEVPWNAPFYARLGFVRVDDADLTPAHRERMREETERGLSPAIRVAMRLDPGA